MTTEPLAEVFAPPKVKKLGGALSYPRGFAYYLDGRVELSEGPGPGIERIVRGTMPYVVRLWVDGGEPGWSCTCPAAEDGSFCKHCVAMALSLSPEPPRLIPARATRKRSPPSSPAQLLAGFIGRLPKERLAEIVLEQAASDWRLRERLLAEDRAGRGEGPDLVAWRRRITRAFAPVYRGFVADREIRGWTAGIGDTIEALEDILEAGHPDEVALLVEHAYVCAEKAADYVEDRDGQRLYIIAERLSDLHYRACAGGNPKPAELASRLLELELSSDLEGFYQAAVAYADILGVSGLAAYRRHLDRRLTRIEARSSDDPGSSYRLGQAREALVSWAVGVGDPDTLIDTLTEVRGTGRFYPPDVMRIIEALTSAGREDETIAWARRGLSENARPHHHAQELRDYLAGALRERGDAGGAVELFWDAFAADPSVTTYRLLLQEAGSQRVGGADWSGRCVEELRLRLSGHVAETDWAGRTVVPAAAKALVEIVLYEGRIEEAWAAATEFGCDHQMRLTLARARESTHPLEVIEIYEPEVLSQIERTKTPAYKIAVELMDRIRRLADAANEPHRFTDLVERVRTEQRFKRNLKKLLDEKGW